MGHARRPPVIHRGEAACRRDLRVESNERRPARAGVRAVMSTAAREGLMREHEAGRPRSPWRWHPWFKRISNAATQSQLRRCLPRAWRAALPRANNKGRDDDRDGRDQRRQGSGRRQRPKPGQQIRERSQRGTQVSSERTDDKAGRDGDGGNSDRERKQERQDDESSDDSPAVNKKQQSNQNNQDSNNSDGDEDTAGGNDDDHRWW